MSVSAKDRVVAVDVLRGLTVALMVLVNDPGDWKHVYPQLDHAEWNGWTLTDLVFPSFLFLVGCSLVFSMEGRISRGESRLVIVGRLAKRCGLLLAVGWLLALFPYFRYSRLRLFGVLPRIAICGFAAGLIVLAVRRARPLLLVIAGLLAVYWVLMRWTPVPGAGWPVRDFPLLDPDRNLAACADRAFTAWTQRWFHTGRLYEVTRDPEGLFSSLPAIASALLGSVMGLWLRRPANDNRPVKREWLMLTAGAAMFSAGEIWSLWFPINKKLWTSSYVLLTGGLSTMALAWLYAILDVRRVQQNSALLRRLIWPWLVFGANAIVAFSFSVVVVKLLLWWKVVDEGKSITAWLWIYRHGFASGGSTEVTSVVFALVFTAVCFLPCWWLWRKRIFVRL